MSFIATKPSKQVVFFYVGSNDCLHPYYDLNHENSTCLNLKNIHTYTGVDLQW
jgi:hypothetical protein